MIKDRPSGAARLVALRERVGLTSAQLADAAGIDRPTVSRLESGQNAGTRRATREALAKAFGVTVGKLSAYLDGDATLDVLMPDPKVVSNLDKALAYHGPGRWSEGVVQAAKGLPLQLSPSEWTAQLDDMETAVKAAPNVWKRLVQERRSRSKA